VNTSIEIVSQRTHLCALKIHIVVPYLKVDSNEVNQRNVITTIEYGLIPHSSRTGGTAG
jgi:hypothetical protein